AGGRPARGLLEARGRRRLHALTDLRTGRHRGVRGPGRAGAPAAGSVPAGLPRRHPARPPSPGRLTALRLLVPCAANAERLGSPAGAAGRSDYPAPVGSSVSFGVADLYDRRPPNSSARSDTNSRTLIA